MEQIRIRGGNRLKGTINISGAKNAALALMAAGLLADGPVKLLNVPDLTDIRSMTALLRQLGVIVTQRVGSLALDGSNIASTTAPYDLVRKMRASILVLGPLVARFGKAVVSLPGGCAIGNRPIDLHLKGLETLGATVEVESGYVRIKSPARGRLVGARVSFGSISVGATETLMMAAALAKGETVLVNAAREPEIVDLARLLAAMGVEIEGAGTDTIHIQGREALQGAEHRVLSDRIETGTYAVAAALTGGEIFLDGADGTLIETAIDTLRRAGVTVEIASGGIRVSRDRDRPIVGVDIMTEPHPGFPSDLQAQFMALMSVATGASMITETIFENRFMHVPELSRMGANITVHQASALVRGVEWLAGAPVMATDLRASVSLVLAGLAARGETIVNRIYHLDRGYERLVEKLSACGAEIERTAQGRSVAGEQN